MDRKRSTDMYVCIYLFYKDIRTTIKGSQVVLKLSLRVQVPKYEVLTKNHNHDSQF